MDSFPNPVGGKWEERSIRGKRKGSSCRTRVPARPFQFITNVWTYAWNTQLTCMQKTKAIWCRGSFLTLSHQLDQRILGQDCGLNWLTVDSWADGSAVALRVYHVYGICAARCGRLQRSQQIFEVERGVFSFRVRRFHLSRVWSWERLESFIFSGFDTLGLSSCRWQLVSSLTTALPPRILPPPLVVWQILPTMAYFIGYCTF